MSLYQNVMNERVVEAHQFDGSSTGMGEFISWFDSGVFRKRYIRTCDLGRQLPVMTIEGEVFARGGDWVLMDEKEKELTVLTPTQFAVAYRPLS